jgi:hypothetical protein
MVGSANVIHNRLIERSFVQTFTIKEIVEMKDMTRRGFGRAFAGFAAAAVTAPATLVHAADMPHVDPADAQAKALGYTHDASAVDTAKYPNFVAGSNCASCQLYLGGDEWGGCGIFPGKAVNANGWCSAYAKKPA